MAKRVFLVILVVVVALFIAQAAGVEVFALFKGFWTFLGDLFEPGRRY